MNITVIRCSWHRLGRLPDPERFHHRFEACGVMNGIAIQLFSGLVHCVLDALKDVRERPQDQEAHCSASVVGRRGGILRSTGLIDWLKNLPCNGVNVSEVGDSHLGIGSAKGEIRNDHMEL